MTGHTLPATLNGEDDHIETSMQQVTNNVYSDMAT